MAATTLASCLAPQPHVCRSLLSSHPPPATEVRSCRGPVNTARRAARDPHFHVRSYCSWPVFHTGWTSREHQYGVNSVVLPLRSSGICLCSPAHDSAISSRARAFGVDDGRRHASWRIGRGDGAASPAFPKSPQAFPIYYSCTRLVTLAREVSSSSP